MEQTKKGRASQQEYKRLEKLLEKIPDGRKGEHHLVVGEDVPTELVSSFTPTTNIHPVLNNVIRIFSHLLEKSSHLYQEAVETQLPVILLFAESASLQSSDEASIIRQMAKMLPILSNFSNFLVRIVQVFRNLLMQIRQFHYLTNDKLSGASNVVLVRCWRSLGELLSILVYVDEIFRSRNVIQTNWHVFRRAIQTAQHNPSQFGINEENLPSLLSTLTLIEGNMISGNVLRNAYEQSYGDVDDDVTFANRMKSAILSMYQRWEHAAETDVPEKKRLLCIVGLSVFYHLHFKKPDKKVLKSVWNCHKKVMVFHLIGDILWNPCAFLLKEIPDITSIVDRKSILAVQAYRESVNITTLLDEAVSYVPTASEWELEMEAEVKNINTTDAATSLKMAELVLKGARIADTISRLLKSILNCLNNELMLSKSQAFQVFDVLESVKNISFVFTRNWRLLNEAVQLASQQWRCHALVVLDRSRLLLRETADQEKNICIEVAMHSLLSTGSQTRLSLCGLVLDICQHEKFMKPQDVGQLECLLCRIGTLLQPQQLILRVTDCSYLMFHRSLIQVYFETIFERMPSIVSIERFLQVLTDCFIYVKATEQKEILDHLYDFIWNSTRNGLLVPLCAFVEGDLRILTHQHLAVSDDDRTPLQKYIFVKSLFKRLPKLAYFDTEVDIKEFVSQYLEKTFYNFTSVSLYDCHTYCKMSMLAQDRYDLNIIFGNLPHHSVDESLDVMHVIVSLNMFVEKYNYCMNQQIFIEKQSPNKSLRVVTSDHMADSLRTHGLGILNTSVNIIYQLLRKKFSIFAQFLADEHIRGQLQRDRRHFEQKKQEYDNQYPVKRAERFNRALDKLGLEEGDESYMDKLRQLVTQVGNAIGFVRSMTSAANQVNSQMKRYDVDELDVDLVTDVTSDDDDVMKTFKDILRDMRDSDTRTHNFIKMLIEIFAGPLNDKEKYPFLENFYILVPSLIINHMTHMSTCRERLKKRGQQTDKELTFVDDGFVLGVAYLLTVLRQWNPYLTLHWMESLEKKLSTDGKNIANKLNDSADRRSDALKVDLINAAYKEYKLVMYTFQSARVFFSPEDDENLDDLEDFSKD